MYYLSLEDKTSLPDTSTFFTAESEDEIWEIEDLEEALNYAQEFSCSIYMNWRDTYVLLGTFKPESLIKQIRSVQEAFKITENASLTIPSSL